ncbi:MAG: helix-turn-helix transcriptional regulator [Bdellovibrionales bacterium]|nr:helix-turn-helix transcriptional regulator [Bdellovibrionales bacterium]
MKSRTCTPSPTLETLVQDLLGRIADKWTLVVVDELGEETLRFSQLQKKVTGISQKVLTQTLRELEKDGLVERMVYPEVPPRVEYRLTKMGYSLGEAVCGIWKWASKNCDEINKARAKFEMKQKSNLPRPRAEA